LVDFLQVLEGAAYVGFIAGAIFAVLELREIRRDRKLDLLMRMHDSWCTPEFEEATIKIMRGNFTTGPEAEEQCSVVSLKMVADYFDHAASLARQGLVDAKWIVDVYDFEACYEKMKPWILAWEEQMPGRYDDFRHMANETRTRRLAAEKKVKGG